ncbi:MAG: pyridoxamine 5'-phosphate oxidase [Ignavibacteriae bacterium 37-53-5]|nr:MAG: pyridoxamine 5'-phosphate oxidase [Ignavibacteriae bacterium 37-53-5]
MLDETSVDRDPFRQFEEWLELAVKAEVPDPHAMVVATSSPDGIPSARVVLLREFDRNGLVFYTNYASRKGTEALTNPKASIVFFWHEMDRQIRIEGELEKIDAVDSDRYFASRPRESQIAAWASNQSGVISGRNELQKRFDEFQLQFDGRPVPRPENWGGLRLRPRTFEFWQGRPNRLHDRIAYSLTNGRWEVLRLAP